MVYKHNGNSHGRPISGRQLYQAQKRSERGSSLNLIVLGWVNRQRQLVQRAISMSDAFDNSENPTASSHNQEDNGDR